MAGEERAINILREIHAAEDELIGKAIICKAGTISHVYLDEAHGLSMADLDREVHRKRRTVRATEDELSAAGEMQDTLARVIDGGAL